MPRKQYFFVHIPKTGGTSLRNALAEALPPEQLFFVSEFSEIDGLRACELPSLRVVGGHIPYWMFQKRSGGQAAARETFAVLRDPLERLLSLYNYLSRSEHSAHAYFFGISFQDFLSVYASGIRPQMHMCYYFDCEGRYTESRNLIFREKIAVYTLDELDRVRRVLCWKLGVFLPRRTDNKSRCRATRRALDGVDLAFLENDRELYEAARRREFPRLVITAADVWRACVQSPHQLAREAFRAVRAGGSDLRRRVLRKIQG